MKHHQGDGGNEAYTPKFPACLADLSCRTLASLPKSVMHFQPLSLIGNHHLQQH